MNKIDKLIIIIALLVSFVSLGISWRSNDSSELGGLRRNPNAYSATSTYSSVSVTGETVVQILTVATTTRAYARICNIGGGTVFVFKQPTDNGVVVRLGHPLYSTTTTNGDNCLTLGVNDPYLGALWAVSEIATSTVMVEQQR